MNELESLLQLKQQNPTDDKILSQLAFYYLKNPDGNKELDYFKQAYELNPSIKNSHNYTFWAYYEYGQDELAQQLFQEVMAKNPKSFYPYMAYGQFLFTIFRCGERSSLELLKNNADLLIALYQKSLEKFNQTVLTYQQNHYEELIYIYTLLANIYVINDDYLQAKNNYNNALHVLTSYLNQQENQDINHEYEYIILYNLLILSKLERNKNDEKYLLKEMKKYKSTHEYEIFYLRRRKANKLKYQLRYFSKCWLFGCEHCDNLADDE